MDYKRIALLLEDQLKLAAQREEELLKVIADQNEQLNILTAEVKSLNSSILSLEKALLEKNASLEGRQSKVRILGKMVSGKKSEQVSVPDKGTTIIAKVKPSLKERGNNGARRKEYFNLETCHHDIYPDAAEFKVEEGKKYVRQIASATNLFLPVLSSISITSTIMPVKALFMPEVCQLSPC